MGRGREGETTEGEERRYASLWGCRGPEGEELLQFVFMNKLLN